MVAVTGFAQTGSAQALACSDSTCQELGACTDPQAHLAQVHNATLLLRPNDPARIYAERNKDGRRWRIVKTNRDGVLRAYVDDMGPEDAFTAHPFDIPSVGDDPSEWNTVGECFDIARERHLLPVRHKAQPATGAAYLNELMERNALLRAWKAARSQFGPLGKVQRNA